MQQLNGWRPEHPRWEPRETELKGQPEERAATTMFWKSIILSVFSPWGCNPATLTAAAALCDWGRKCFVVISSQGSLHLLPTHSTTPEWSMSAPMSFICRKVSDPLARREAVRGEGWCEREGELEVGGWGDRLWERGRGGGVPERWSLGSRDRFRQNSLPRAVCSSGSFQHPVTGQRSLQATKKLDAVSGSSSASDSPFCPSFQS